MTESWPFPTEVCDLDTVRNRYNYKEFDDKHFRYEVKRYKGYAVIFNNTTFAHSKFRERVQSHFDVEALRDTLIDSLQFRSRDIDIMQNKTANQMSLILEEVARKDLTEHSCLLVVVLSYGEVDPTQRIVHGTDGPFTYQQLLSPFKYPKVSSLIDTPKFFIIQSERAENDGFSHNAPVPPPLSSPEITDPDTLFFYSVDPEFISWRLDGHGSWFIQRLCEVLKEDGLTLDITQLFVRTLKMVRLDYESYVRNTVSTKIFCPRIVSLLSKEFKFCWD